MSVHTYYDLLRKAVVAPDSGFPSAQAPVRSGAWIHPQAILLATPSNNYEYSSSGNLLLTNM
jgi:hypothetical protein